MLQEAGWSLQHVQALTGHSSETMRKVYLEGHDAPWQPASTGAPCRDRATKG